MSRLVAEAVLQTAFEAVLQPAVAEVLQPEAAVQERDKTNGKEIRLTVKR